MAKGGPARVEITGAKELRRALKRMGEDAADLTAVHRSVADAVAQRAREIVPVESGHLRDSIRPSATRTKASVLAGKAVVPYAGPIHFGWPARNISPQPFLYHALDDRATRVVDLYEARIEALVVRVGRDAP